jgi:hypothetical protein
LALVFRKIQDPVLVNKLVPEVNDDALQRLLEIVVVIDTARARQDQQVRASLRCRRFRLLADASLHFVANVHERVARDGYPEPVGVKDDPVGLTLHIDGPAVVSVLATVRNQ